MTRIIGAALAALLLAAAPSAAQMYKPKDSTQQASKPRGVTFERWYNFCKETDTKIGNAKSPNKIDSVTSAQFCFGLTLGVADGASVVIKDAKLNTICIPNGTPTREMVEVGQLFYQKILAKDPDLRNANFAMGLAWAFYNTWPCVEEKAS